MAEPGGSAPPLSDVLQIAARVWLDFTAGQSLQRAFSASVARDAPGLRGAVMDASFAAARRRALIERVIGTLASRPPVPDVAALLAVALAQLLGGRYATYTVVDQAVEAARRNAATAPAAGFVNAVLRNFERRREELMSALQPIDEVRYNAPPWWIAATRAAHPAEWRQILETAQLAPPLVLRINRRRADVADYLQRLADAGVEATRVGRAAVWLHRARPVEQIPGFLVGEVSVQDAGAQLAAEWLRVADGMRVLDACAAPGGKTAHLTELADLDLTAIERDAERAPRIHENLGRIGCAARVLIADARDPSTWWDGRRFDRILLDAPCTASGIVRRHPDIPWLRRGADVAHLATEQGALLDALWPLLEVGGRLLYVVCSVFPQEGSEQITQFIGRHADAVPHALPGGATGVQLLPTPVEGSRWIEGSGLPTLHDGFFYAYLSKSG